MRKMSYAFKFGDNVCQFLISNFLQNFQIKFLAKSSHCLPVSHKLSNACVPVAVTNFDEE